MPEEIKKWEYCTRFWGSSVSESMLNRMGDEGWELVSVVQVYPGTLMQYFKRPKVEKKG